MQVNYDTMIESNLERITKSGFAYDASLKCVRDERYCFAVYSNISGSHFTDAFYELQTLLSNEECGITFSANNIDHTGGTFHFTFIQQVTFSQYNSHEITPKMVNKCHEILLRILKPQLPFEIHYNKLIAVTNGLVLCSNKCDTDVNYIRETYRAECKKHGLPLLEPYHLDILHSTLFRFTHLAAPDEFLKKYECYLQNNIDYGYAVIDNFSIGHCTLKMNPNEVHALKNCSTEAT